VTFFEDTSLAPPPPQITAGWIEHPTPRIAVVTPLALATEAPRSAASCSRSSRPSSKAPW